MEKKKDSNEPDDIVQDKMSKSTTNLAKLNRYLSSIDSDLIFSKLKGGNKNPNDKKYDKNIHTPELGLREFYSGSQGSHGKLDFMNFVKSIEMISLKLFPEFPLETSLNYLWNNHLSILLKTLEKNKIDERSIGNNKIEELGELLKNKDIPFKNN